MPGRKVGKPMGPAASVRAGRALPRSARPIAKPRRVPQRAPGWLDRGGRSPPEFAASHGSSRGRAQSSRTRPRTRPPQHGALQYGDRLSLRGHVVGEPQQRMFDEREQRRGRQTVERRLGAEPRENAGGRRRHHHHRNRKPRSASARALQPRGAQARGRASPARRVCGRRQRLAQRDGDGERLLLDVAGRDHTEVRKRRRPSHQSASDNRTLQASVAAAGRSASRDEVLAGVRLPRPGQIFDLAARQAEVGPEIPAWQIAGGLPPAPHRDARPRRQRRRSCPRPCRRGAYRGRAAPRRRAAGARWSQAAWPSPASRRWNRRRSQDPRYAPQAAPPRRR